MLPSGNRLPQGGEIVVPERPRDGGEHAGTQALQRAGRIERPDRPGQIYGITRGAQDPVDAVLHGVRDRTRPGGDDGHPELERDQRVLGGGGRSVGQHQGVSPGEEPGDVGGGHVCPGHGHPVLQPEIGDQPQEILPAGPDLPGDGQRYLLPGLGERPQQDVEPFVGAHDPEKQQPVTRARRSCPGGRRGLRQDLCPGGNLRAGGPGDPGGRPAGGRQMRWQRRDLHRGGGQGFRPGRLRGGVDDHRVHPAQQGPHQRLVGAAVLMRLHVVAQRDHRAAPGPGRSGQGQVGRRLDRRDDGQHHHVAALAGQPAAGQPPAVRPVPGQRPFHARVQSYLRLGDGQLAGVEESGVLRPPGHQNGVMAGGRQPVGESGGVLGRPALVRMGGAHDRDLHSVRHPHGPDRQVDEQRGMATIRPVGRMKAGPRPSQHPSCLGAPACGLERATGTDVSHRAMPGSRYQTMTWPPERTVTGQRRTVSRACARGSAPRCRPRSAPAGRWRPPAGRKGQRRWARPCP